MDQVCSKCAASNHGQSRFCQACGFTLGATMTQQRTVVVSAPALAPPTPQAVFPAGVPVTSGAAAPVMPPVSAGIPSSERNGQREQTVFVEDTSGSNEIASRRKFVPLRPVVTVNTSRIASSRSRVASSSARRWLEVAPGSVSAWQLIGF